MAITSLICLSISPWPDPTRGESPRGVRRMALSARPQLTSTTAAGLVAATSTPASVARLSASWRRPAGPSRSRSQLVSLRHLHHQRAPRPPPGPRRGAAAEEPRPRELLPRGDEVGRGPQRRGRGGQPHPRILAQDRPDAVRLPGRARPQAGHADARDRLPEPAGRPPVHRPPGRRTWQQWASWLFARQAHGQTGRATQLSPPLARLRLQRIQRSCHRRPVCIGVDRAVGALLPSWSMTW